MSVDVAWTKWRKKRGDAFRKTLLVDRVVRRQADVEHEVEPSKFREGPYVTNRNALTSIFDWKGTARLRESHRYPAALRQHVSVVDIFTPNRRVPHLKWIDCEQKETGDDRIRTGLESLLLPMIGLRQGLLVFLGGS